jgi:very-short-patch-repair endonuclease
LGAEEPKRRQSELNRLAQRQGGTVGREQLRRLGFTLSEIRTMLHRGELIRLHRGVFLYGCGRPYAKGALFGGLLALGPSSFLSHRSSAAAQGLRPIAPSYVEVTVPGKPRPRQGLIVHRTSTEPHPSETTERFGLRYSSNPRMLIEVAPRETSKEIDRLITLSIRRGLFDPQKLAEAIERHSRRPGLTVVRAAAARYLELSDRSSQLEVSFDEHAERDARIPRYEKNVHLGPYEFDCHFVEQRVIVELDGRPYHTVIRDLENDHAKNTWCQLNGLRILRITDFRWEHDRAGAIEDLLTMLEAPSSPHPATSLQRTERCSRS